MADLLIVHEHDQWQKPLFDVLERRGLPFDALNVRKAAFASDDMVTAKLVFNQATPSAYTRGQHRAVPQALAYLRHAEALGCRVINGSGAFLHELSKAAQVASSRKLGIDHPHSIVFNDVEAAIEKVTKWPRLLKPDMGGSGARIQVVHSPEELKAIFQTSNIWEPDHLFLLQEYLEHDAEHGIVRIEYLGGEYLYAMRVITHGRYNLCPSVVCNPDDGQGACVIEEVAAKPVEFVPYPEVSEDAVQAGKKLLNAGGIDVGAVEYLESNGRRVFYDVNANSNLRANIGQAFGFNPFERVADYLAKELSEVVQS